MLSRKLLEHPLTTQLPAAWFRVFIVILLRVNWRPGVWWNGTKNVEIQPGSLVTSVEKLSKMARASVRQTRGALAYLKATKTAAIETTNNYTVITVLNWTTYQNPDEYEGKPNDKAEGEPTTNQRQADDKPATRIKEGKNAITEERKKNTEQDYSAVFREKQREKTPEATASPAFDEAAFEREFERELPRETETAKPKPLLRRQISTARNYAGMEAPKQPINAGMGGPGTCAVTIPRLTGR